MTDEQRAAMRAMYTEKIPAGYTYSLAREHVITLLGENEDEAASANRLRSETRDLIEKITNFRAENRQFWRRADALERAIRSCDDSDYASCQTCVHNKTNVIGCEFADECGEQRITWEFDEARFAEA